jgi:hypothetical protein
MAAERRSNQTTRLAQLGKERGMNRKSYRDILDSAAADSLPQDINLWPKLSAQLERKSLMMTLRTRPFLAILIALLILLTLSGVGYALGRAFGYIPGVGLVDQSAPVRILAEPVTDVQDGISISVSKVVADSMRTYISYGVDGIPPAENGLPACLSVPELHLPDGSKLEMLSGSGGIALANKGNSMSYKTEYEYASIPVGTDQVIFVLPCTFPDERGLQNLEVPLNLVQAPSGFATPVSVLAITPESLQNKSGLSLENVLELSDSYILIGKFTDRGDLPGPLVISTSSDTDYLPHIEDADGNPVLFKAREDVRPEPEWDVAYHWAYEIPKPVQGPLKLTVDRVNIREHSEAQFQFDTGDKPQLMQKWDLNLPIQLGKRDIFMESVTYLGNGYAFQASSENLPEGNDPLIYFTESSLPSAQVDQVDSTNTAVGGKTIFTTTITTLSAAPTGKLTVLLAWDEEIPVNGSWSLTWAPSTTKK